MPQWIHTPWLSNPLITTIEREMREVNPLVWFFIDLNHTAVVDAAYISVFEKVAQLLLA